MTIIFIQLRLPALLAYIMAGLLIGLFAKDFFGESLVVLDHMSHIGLVLLLFIIGMEIDPTIFKVLGRRTVAACLLQAPITIAVVYGGQWLLNQAGIGIPGASQNPEAWFYYAAAASFGSTAVVIKLLGDKFDLGSQAGKITVMTLIMEDIWAIAAISYAHSQTGHTDANVWMIIAGGILLTGICFVVARYALSVVLKQLERSPDLLLLIALGWCFLCSELYQIIGLSGEIGALIAGLFVGRLPQHVEIFSKTISLRDFFMALFFVALGVSLPPPSLDVILPATIVVFIVILARLFIYTPMLIASKQNITVSFVAPVNLAQLSVFALVLMPLAVESGALQYKDQVIISYALLISIVITAFTIPNNYRIAARFAKLVRLDGRKSGEGSDKDEEKAEIIMLGFFVNGPAIMRHIQKTQPDLYNKIVVVDTNTNNPLLNGFPGLNVKYGDFSQPETLRRYGIPKAKVVICTINNAFLHGVRNEILIREIKKVNPDARIITTCLSSEHIENHLNAGAYDCISTPDESAPGYTKAILNALEASEKESEEQTDPKSTQATSPA